MIETRRLEFNTKGENDILNITDQVEEIVRKSDAKDGFALLFLQSTTSSLSIIEAEEGLFKDFAVTMEGIAPKSREYEHEKAWHDGNGHSHMKSSILGVSLSIPFAERKLLLGTWQQIILTEFDIRPRRRTLVIQIHA